MKYPSITFGKDVPSPTVHFLKIDLVHFINIRSGKKKAEFRKNDRGFKVGDALILIEMNHRNKETGRFIIAEIDHILHDWEHKEMPDHHAMLSIHVVYPDNRIRAFF